MTTKLYGAENQRLFTAAEARRIDIERGGEGRIRHGNSVNDIGFDEHSLCWMDLDNKEPCGVNPEWLLFPCWLPLTPEPEFEWKRMSVKLQGALLEEKLNKTKINNEQMEYYANYHKAKCEQLEKELKTTSNLYANAKVDIDRLEKELAELKKERDNDIYYRLYTDAQKQRDEYKNNYHEILAGHGELTRKFDEATKQLKLLKEKQLTKEDFQLIQIGRLILEVNKRAWELREADL